MNTDAGLLHTRDDRGVHSLTLNTPRSFNVLSEAMLIALQAAIDAVAADPKARLVVIGASGKAFCAGHDLKEMKANPELTYYQALFARCS
ncbi:enoyl-CoA hydratase/isomerase family protein, partial [Hydrogenophaga sp.]